MSTLEGKSIATTYKDLLQVSNNNVGIDGTIRPIEDGEGTQSALALSTDTIEIRGSIIPSTNSTFDIGSAERKIRHLYLSSNSLYVGDLQFSEQDVQEVKNVRGGAYATSAQGALAETAIQPGEFAFSLLSEIPTTLAGYGITDAATAAQGAAADTALAKASTALQPGGVSFTDDLTDRPTTIAGYGITDAFNGSFSNLTDRPTSLAGYGITDAATSAQGDKADSALQPGAIIPFSNVSNRPTSLAGYGITDAATSAQGDKADSALQPGATIPWSTVSNTPTTLAGYNITDAATSTQGDKADSALQPNTSIHVNTMHVSGGKIYGPATMYIDPEAIGDNTGKLVILGDLQVDGVTTTVNSTTVSVSGKTIELAGGAGDAAEVDGAGVTVAASDASMLYKVTTDSWDFNKKLATAGTNGSSIKITRSNWKDVAEAGDISFHSGGTSGELANPVARIVGLDTFAGGNSPYNGELAFYTLNGNSSNERMRIDTTGNVGIGTTNPSAKLTLPVSESIHFNNSLGETKAEIEVGAAGTLQLQGDFDLRFKTTNEAMRIDSAGRVGIGITNPARLLHLKNNNSAIVFETPIDANGSAYAQIKSGRDGDSGYSSTLEFATTESTTAVDTFGSNGTGGSGFVTRMLINSSGNVGIGTTNPSSTLDISSANPAVRLTDETHNTSAVFSSNNQGDVILNADLDNIVDNSTVQFKIDGSEKMRITSDGKIGIGTNTPGVKLEILDSNQGYDSTTTPNRSVDIRTGTPQNSYSSIGLESRSPNNTDAAISTITCVPVGNGSGALAFGTRHQYSFGERMRINSNGRVGIGTTSPGALLHIAPKNNVDANGDPTNESYFKVYDNDTSGLAQGRNGGVVFIDANYYLGTSTIFAVNGRGDNKFTIQGSGNVGIGTTSPGATLHVKANDDSADALAFWVVNKAHTNSIITAFENGYVQIGNFVYDDATGNVGIGTLSPNSALTVNTDNASSGYAVSIGAGGGGSEDKGIRIIAGQANAISAASCKFIEFYNGNGSTLLGGIRNASASAVEFYGGSDIRIKKNINDTSIKGIDSIKALKLRSWDWNSLEDMGGIDIGLIADELEEVFPELVTREKLSGWEHCVSEGEEDLKTIPSESKITLTLIKAVQEQQQIIETQNSKIDQLLSRIEALENK